MSRYQFLIDTFETERLKTLSVWSQAAKSRWGSPKAIAVNATNITVNRVTLVKRTSQR